jgi:hypothetical protein
MKAALEALARPRLLHNVFGFAGTILGGMLCYRVL